MSPIAVLIRKEAGELLLSLRGIGWLFALTSILSVFSLLLVSNTELSLLDNAQVVYDMVSLVTVLGALLALIVGTDAVGGERERGTLIPLLLTPLSRNGILAGKLGAQLCAWAVTYILALPYLWATGSTGQNLGASILALGVLGTPLVVTFGFFGIGLGARLDSLRTAMLTGLLILILSGSPVLMGPSLRQSAIGRAFDAINPISGALNSYDAMIIDSQSLGAQMEHFATIAIWCALALWFAISSFRNVSR